MKYLLLFAAFLLKVSLQAQNIGIGTTTPLARLHVVDSSVLFSSSGDIIPFSGGNPPISGPGRRMMWYPDKAAFRAGYVADNSWDKANIGDYSFAAGRGAMAKSYSTVAMGSSSATGIYSVAAGETSLASGSYSVALGTSNISSGDYACTFGRFATASGTKSVGIGFNVTASSLYSFAMGFNVWANGIGSFFLGDSDPYFNGVLASSTPNEMAMRFNGGYYFITNDNVPGYIGVRVPSGGNSWATISDVRRKENFLPVDGELFLRKIAAMKLTTWNYQKQDPKTFRHYGPMAQDFYAAFGKDEIGSIGCDTLINQQDFIGVNFIAVQALEKRTTELSRENQELRKENRELIARLENLEKLILPSRRDTQSPPVKPQENQ